MDFFPQEVLIEILRNVDRGKKQLSLVSKSFYNAFSSLNEDVWLVINSKILNDKSIYKSILETTRRIRNIKLDFYQKSEIKEKQALRIIELQSKNITQLVLNGSFSQEFLEEIFKLIPKLNLLDLKEVTISRFDSTSSSPAPSKKMKMSEPEKLNLLQVKKLTLPKITSNTSKYILDLMNNLDHGTLNELKVETNSYATIHELIEKQPNLKVLKLVQGYSYFGQNENVILPRTFLNNCDLEHLEWKIRYGTIDDAQRNIVDSILKRMKNLKVLKLYQPKNSLEKDIPTRRFNIITSNLKKLETLEIYTEDIDDDITVANLNNLTQLRNLTLDFNRSNFQIDIFPMFDQETLPQLQSFAALKMSDVNYINFIERMSRTILKNVKKLNIAIPQDMRSFQAIFRYFPQIESLTFYQSSYIHFLVTIPSELQNLNLKELDMTFNLDCTIKSIRELCECFPNLEKLTIRCIGLGDSGLDSLLRNLRMLKYLKLEVPYTSKVPFDKRMNSILKFGQNLEVVIYQAKIGSPDILKMFEDKFEYIDIKRNYPSKLTLAVNRKILNSYPCAE